jgi:hypothetical protein
MITMYDSVTLQYIPSDATVIGGYVDGQYATFHKLPGLFPHARLLSLAVYSKHDADFLDAEGNGNAELDEFPAWYLRQKKRGVARPGVYASADPIRDHLPGILKAAGIDRSSVRVWAAHYTNHAHVCGPQTCNEVHFPVDGTQFTKHARGVNLDQSLLNDNFFDEPPTPYPCEGHKSLNGLSQQLHNPVSEILRLTAEHSPGGKFYSGIAGYLNGVFAADTVKVPLEVTVYNPVPPTPQPFTSSGHQTLQGLANSFGCKPSDIVQCTAWNSPGAVFSKGMADYLNGVFSRSSTHVPPGTHLFYQK